MALSAAPSRFPKAFMAVAAMLALSLNMTSCVSAEKNAGVGEFDVPADPKMLSAETHRHEPDMATAATMPQPDPVETVADDGQPALPGQVMMETRVAASSHSIYASEPAADTAEQVPQSATTTAYAAPNAMNPVQSSLFGGTPVDPVQQQDVAAEKQPPEQPIIPLTAEESQAYDDPVVTVPANGQMESAKPAPVTIAPAEPKKKKWSIAGLFAGFHKKNAPEPVE